MSDTSYQPKNIILKHSTEFSVLTTYDDEKNDGKINFKAEIVDKNKNSDEYNKYFSVAEEECFINNESHILLDYYEKDEKKLIEIFNGFDKLAKNANYCFYDMRKTVLKYLLYKYGENDKYLFWEEVKQNFLKNYYFIDKIEQLIEKAKENQKNGKSGLEKKLKHYYDLTYEVFTDTNFNISNIQQEFEPSEANHCDNKKLFQRFISILIGALNEKKEFDIVENFKNLKEGEDKQTQNEKSKRKLYQTIAAQLQKFDKLPKDIAKQIYLLSLDEKESKIVFVDFFKGTENNNEQKNENENGDKQEQNVNVNTQTNKYKQKWEEIKKNYQEIYDAKDEIINDLFALHFFTDHDFKTKKFLRLPLWKILQLSFSSDKYKNECIIYLDTLEKQLKKGGTESSQQNESEKSLLNKMEILLEDDKFDIKVKKYFPINNKNNQKRILFNLPIEDLPGNDIKDTIPQLFIDLVNDIINKSLKQLTNNVKSNQELYNNIEEAKKKVFQVVLKSLDKKSITKYGNKENQTLISDDFLKFRTISLEPIWYTLPMSLNLSLKQEKSLPKFLDKITIKPEELSALLLETFKLKEPFFERHIFMQSLLKIIIQKSSETPIIKKITNINDFIKKRIIELNLLYKIHDLICSIWSLQIEEAVSEEEKDVSEEEIDVSEEKKEDNILSDDIIPKIFETLMNRVSISDIPNVDDIKEKLSDLIMYSNEFCRRLKRLKLKLNNSVLFDLQIYYLTINNTNLPGSQIKELITWFNNKDQSFNEKLFPLLEQLIQNNENKNAIKLLELFYLKTKVNIEDNNEETPQKNNNLEKEIIMFLFKKPELYFESIQLFQVIFKNMNLIEKDEKGEQKINLKNLHDSNIDCEQMHSQFIFIHILEKIFLSKISERKVENFNEYNNIKEKMVGDIKDLNDEMIKNKQKNVCIGENFYQLVAIAFLRVYFKIYLEVLKSGKNTSYCSEASDYFNDNQQENIVKILEYYVLKIIRTKYCKSFREFRSYNFSGDQMLWVSDLKFKGNSETEFEYQFFSFWDDSVDYFNKYKEFNNKIFIPLKKESFRTSKFDDEIKKFFEEEDNIEIFVDVIMNVILCNTWEKDYISKMEYVEFTTWAQPFIENLGDKILENWKNYLLYLSANNNENDQKPGFNKILGSFTKEENEKKMTILDLETIFISLKFVLAFIIRKVELPIKEEQPEILEETDKTKLIKKLNEFIIKSTEFYQKFDNDKCKDLLTSFNEIKDLLRFNNINQIKLFMNFLYYKLKKSDNQKKLTEIIELAIKDWPNQESVIKKYYEFVDYKEERIRNVILDERFTDEALLYKDKDSCLKIPVYRYFYYEELPSWNHLINEYLPKIANEDIKTKYPYIYYFSDGDQDRKYKIYGDYPESDVNPNPIYSKNIKEIIRNKEEIEYYPFTYSGFECLDEMAVYYSKSFVFKTKTPNPDLGYMIKYDVQAIENELSAIEKLVIEKTKVSMEEKDYIGKES